MPLEIFKCDVCSKSCDTRGKLNRHMKTHSKPFRCDTCSVGFALRLDLERHIKARHSIGNNQYYCRVNQCSFKSNRKDNLNRHIKKSHASTLLSAKNNTSVADTTTVASLPEAVALSSAVKSFNGIGSVSLFMQAASLGDITTLELLMDSGFTTETKADDRSTALHCAARNGQSKTVQYLLRKDARSDSMNEKRRLPLHEAFLSNDVDTVRVLMEQMPEGQLQHTNWDNEHHLVQTKNIEIFKLYVQHPKVRFGAFDMNRIFRNAISAKNDALVAVLLDRADIAVNGRVWENAPILDAARYGNAKAMELLLNSDKVNKSLTTAIRGMNVLHMAASNGHADIVEQLLNFKFDVNSLDYARRTPLQHAAMRGHLEIVKLLADKWNADISCSDRYGYTSLHHAAFKGHWECAHVLLEHIASKTQHGIVDSQLANREFVKKDAITRVLSSAAFKTPNLIYGTSENTLLHYHAQKGNLEILEVLLAHDMIDVNARDYKRRSPLFMAVEKYQIEAVGLLLQHPQIDVNQKNKMGDTALISARRSGHQDIVDLLLSHGAVDDKTGNAPTITTEDSSSLTVKAGHMHGTPLQPENEVNLGRDFDAFLEEAPDLDYISDAEDEMMEQEFS